MIPSLRADGKVVVITGGSKGLGRAMALGFAEAGVVDRRGPADWGQLASGSVRPGDRLRAAQR